MVRPTIAHGLPPTPEEVAERSEQRNKARCEQRLLEEAARRLGVAFTGDAPSVWKLTLALVKRMEREWTDKERQRGAGGTVSRGRRPSLKTAVDGQYLLAVTEAYRENFPDMSDTEIFEDIARRSKAHTGLSAKAISGRVCRAKTKKPVSR
jgi:hypothetical protein